ncbi:MAG: NADH-quinone oxidoreductase subunit [Actinomycetota bacterium]|nr:NADH-quinone oxidoreductase subunit [Actinomycetota bacterium]
MVSEETVSPQDWRERVKTLKQDGWWFSDICGVDLIHSGARTATGQSDDRFLVVAQFLNHSTKERITFHVPAPGEPPTVPTIVDIYPGAGFFERETYDLFGIVFEGHENLSRIMMPDEWIGHPLRKDYGVGKVKVEFLEQPLMQIQSLGQSPGGEEAKQEVDRLGQTAGVAEDQGGRRWRPASERNR